VGKPEGKRLLGIFRRWWEYTIKIDLKKRAEQTVIIYLYRIDGLVFITETECLLRGTDFIYVKCILNLQSPVVTICTTSLTLKIPRSAHSVFMCFVWIWEQAAIISPYSINWLVFKTEIKYLLRGTGCIFTYSWGRFHSTKRQYGSCRSPVRCPRPLALLPHSCLRQQPGVYSSAVSTRLN